MIVNKFSCIFILLVWKYLRFVRTSETLLHQYNSWHLINYIMLVSLTVIECPLHKELLVDAASLLFQKDTR